MAGEAEIVVRQRLCIKVSWMVFDCARIEHV
jgi:hypothetical protein